MVILVNKLSDECIAQKSTTANIDIWDPMFTQPCNEADSRQNINIGEPLKIWGDSSDVPNLKYPIKIGPSNDHLTVTRQYNTDVVWNDPTDARNTANENEREGAGKNGFFKFYEKTGNDTRGSDIVNNAPFRFGPEYYKEWRIHAEGGETIVSRKQNQTDDSQVFLNYDLWKKCKSKGISFDDCTREKLQDCNDPRNKGDFSQCPKEYCLIPSNVSKPECRTFCESNKGLCDQTATEFCSTNPSDSFCNCFGSMPETEYTRKLKEKGMSQKEFSQKTGIAESSISDWKKKHTNPVSDKILIICEVLDISPYELLSGAEHIGTRSRDNQTYVFAKDTELGMVVETYQQLDYEQQKRLLGYMDALKMNN